MASRMLSTKSAILAILASTVTGTSVIELPSVSFTDLFHLDGEASHFSAQILTTLGALQIKDIPGYSEARYYALHDLSDCLLNDIETSSIVTLKDGTRRVSVGAGTAEGKPGRMSSECGYDSAALRSLVHNTMRQLAQALDAVVGESAGSGRGRSQQFVLSPYSTYAGLVDSGSHLENMHSYSFGKSMDKNNATSTLGFHTDGGLFIGMTTGMYSDAEEICEESGLYIKGIDGVISRVTADDSSLIVMIGEGGRRFLLPLLGRPLRAVPHKLELCVKDASALESVTRSWYGKMFLPPNDAIIKLLDDKDSMRYDKFRALEVQSILANHEEQVVELPTVCGSLQLQDMLIASSDSDCANNEVYCWNLCMPVDDLPCGTDAVCVDPITDQVVDGLQMCPEEDHTVCELQCVYNETDAGYCYGSGTSMFMDGFRTFTANGVSNCLNLWFTGWTLDDDAKVAVACLGVLLLGIASQFIAKLRSKYSWPPLVSSFLFLVHITCSYFLMLAAMTYSVEIFCMVCIGMSIGHFAFHTKKVLFPPQLLGEDSKAFSVDADPCCANSVTSSALNQSNGSDLRSPIVDFVGSRQ